MKTTVRNCLAAVSLILLCGALPARADYSNTVASFNPLAYWRLNETAASPALNTVSNSGSVGGAGNAIVDRQVTKGQAGIVGNSILLDNPGSGSIACYSKVDVPFNAALNPAAPFSVEFWAKPRRNDQTLCAMSSINCYWNGGGSRMGWLVYQDSQSPNNRWQFRLGHLSGYTMTTQCSSPNGSVALNTWQHIVATYDGTTARIYVNGALANSLNVSWTTPNTSLPLMMGALTLSGGGASTVDGPAITAQGLAGYRGYDGWLDEVAIYQSVLSAGKVAGHYAAATTNTAGYGAQILADSPLGYWNCDEPAVTPPAPGTFPIAVNSGTVGSALNGTNWWGALAAQTGAAYAGLGAGNKACFFDGDNGYIALGDDPAMHFTGQITMMAWVKPMSKNYFRNIIGHGWDDNYVETFLRLSQGDDGTFNGDGNMYYETGISLDGTQAGYNNNVARYVIPDADIGNWVFVAGTYDGANWNLYRNGVLVASKASDNGAVDVTNRWSIGSRSSPSPTTGSAFYGANATFESEGLIFHGYIDEPAIFNTALSASDIASIYNTAQIPPVIVQAVAVPAGVYKGSSGSFSVWAEGSPTLGYRWTSNGISTGVTTTNLTLNNLAAGNLTVAVVVTNAYSSATSSVTFLVVASKPLITQQPQAISRYIGRAFSFSVGVAGTTPISYQWNTNGTPIPGATSSTYTGVVSTASALNYSVTLTNEAGSSNSATVALTAVPLPTGYGGAVLADAPAAYWRLGEPNGSTTANDYYNGRNGTYFAPTLGQSGYSALDSDTAVAFNGVNSYVGNINGDPATGGINFQGHVNFTLEAWVNAPGGQAEQATIIAKGIGSGNTTANEQFVLDIGSNPANGNGAFRFFTRGNANGAFLVYADIGPDGNWHHVVGVYDDLNVLGLGVRMHIFVDGELRGSAATRAAGLRVSTAPVSIGSKRLGNDPNYDGTFKGIVDEAAIYSYALTLSQISNHYALAYGANTKPTITKQPESQTVYESSPTPPRFEVGAYGTQPLTYQWKKGGVDLVDDGHIFGANTRTLTIGTPPTGSLPVSPADAGNYAVTINNAVGPVTNSAVVTLAVISAPTTNVNVPGLVLHLPFNDSLNDTSGRGNHGTGMRTTLTSTNATAPSDLNPDFYYASDGKLGKALHYHTSTTNGGGTYPVFQATNAYYVTLGDKPDLRFSSNVNFSVAYWVRFPPFNGVGDLGDLPIIATAVGSYSNPGFTFAPSYQLGSWSYSLNGNVQLYGQDYLLDEGAWHHVAHTFDRAGQAITYVDGVRKDVRSVVTAGNLDTGNPVNIGQDPTGSYGEEGYYDIDDIGIWRRALSPLEVIGIYLAGTLANSSFVDITPAITAGPGVNQVTITWGAGTLQSATSVAGPYSDVPGATSPYTVAPTGNRFYRTRF